MAVRGTAERNHVLEGVRLTRRGACIGRACLVRESLSTLCHDGTFPPVVCVLVATRHCAGISLYRDSYPALGCGVFIRSIPAKGGAVYTYGGSSFIATSCSFSGNTAVR